MQVVVIPDETDAVQSDVTGQFGGEASSNVTVLIQARDRFRNPQQHQMDKFRVTIVKPSGGLDLVLALC